MKYKLVDNQPRSVLSEGRSQGIGFALCKRKDNELHTVNPISPCKDYLNDVVYSEHTGEPYSAWGLKTSKKDIFEEVAFLVMAVCGSGASSASKYPSMDKDIAALDKNYKAIEAMLHFFEDQLPTKQRTELVLLESNQVIIVAPLFWVQYTYLVSLYTLILRMGLYYTGGDVMKFLETCNEDGYTWKSALPKVKKLLSGTIPKQDMTKLFDVHDCGILGFQFPA